MCDRATLLAEADRILDGEYVYWRPLTPFELEFGDIDRMRVEFDAAEEAIARAGKPLVRKITNQMLDEAVPLLASGDVAGLSRISPSHVAELASAFRAASTRVIATGRKQVLDTAARHGVKLAAKPPKKDPKKAADYIAAKSDAIAEAVAAQAAANMKRVVMAAAARGVDELDEEAVAALEALNARALVGSALELGRESYDVGRLYGYEEVKDEVAYVIYTAAMDDNTCEVCAEADGAIFEDPDEGWASAPNEGCLGGDRCRCVPIAAWK